MSRINFILLGESGVGKSTLLNRYKTGQFSENITGTISVEFHVEKIHVEGKEINLFLWDTSGQERFNAVVRSYYRKGDGVLLVYDVTDPTSFYKLSKWLCDLKASNEDAKILIVGNKNDDPSRKTVTASMVSNFARDENLEYMEISARTGENIDKAFDYLIKEVLVEKGILPKTPKSPSKTPCDGLPKSKKIIDEKEGKDIITLDQIEKPKKKSSSCC